MNTVKRFMPGIGLCFVVAVAALFCGRLLPIVGGPVFAILIGMVLAVFLKTRGPFQAGIGFTSRKILQYAVILLGFGMDLSTVAKTGLLSLPIILATIAAALLTAFALHHLLRMPKNISLLTGVGSAICGGSAIAAVAPVIGAGDEEVARSISVIFLFNVLAAALFPLLGAVLGFSTVSGEAFGIFAGTAINDTSSVTAAASTWDALYGLGTQTLDQAVTVKLTRALAIIPVAAALAFCQARRSENKNGGPRLRRTFPYFILWFLLASLLTTIAGLSGVPPAFFMPLKTLSKFFIIMAMSAIGLNTDPVRLIRSGGRPLLMGFCCWISIIGSCLLMMRLLGFW